MVMKRPEDQATQQLSYIDEIENQSFFIRYYWLQTIEQKRKISLSELSPKRERAASKTIMRELLKYSNQKITKPILILGLANIM